MNLEIIERDLLINSHDLIKTKQWWTKTKERRNTMCL